MVARKYTEAMEILHDKRGKGHVRCKAGHFIAPNVPSFPTWIKAHFPQQGIICSCGKILATANAVDCHVRRKGKKQKYVLYKIHVVSLRTACFLLDLAKDLPPDLIFIIDSPSLGCVPCSVTNSEIMQEAARSNVKGEADSAIWQHAYNSDCEQILVVANDTDIFMYGLAFLEMGYLKSHNTGSKNWLQLSKYSNASIFP